MDIGRIVARLRGGARDGAETPLDGASEYPACIALAGPCPRHRPAGCPRCGGGLEPGGRCTDPSCPLSQRADPSVCSWRHGPPTAARRAAESSEMEAIHRAKQAVESGEEWDECGGCGGWHPVGWHGDCRDDERRLPAHPEDVLGSATTDERAALAAGPGDPPRLRPPRPNWYGAFDRKGPAGAARGIGRIAVGLRAGATGTPARAGKVAAALGADAVLRMVFHALQAGVRRQHGIVGVEIGVGADGRAQITLKTIHGGDRQAWVMDAESILEADSGSDVATPRDGGP